MSRGLVNYKASMESLGWMVGLVEKYIPQARRTIDLFGFADYVAIIPGREGTTFIQTTSGSGGNGSARVLKILDLEEPVRKVLAAGNYIEVWQWKRYKPRGTKRITVDAKRWGILLLPDGLRSIELPSYRELKAGSNTSSYSLG